MSRKASLTEKNTTELFGYDFMLSTSGDTPKVWLIEVNSSPACDYSTPVTCPLVKQMMEDTAKVMVDLRENPDASTGEWERIEHQLCKPLPSKKNGPLNLEVVGNRIKRPKGWKKKRKKRNPPKGEETSDSRSPGDNEDGADDEDDEELAAESDSDS